MIYIYCTDLRRQPLINYTLLDKRFPQATSRSRMFYWFTFAEKVKLIHRMPIKYSRWTHHSGRTYTVIMITNRWSTKSEYPITIVYEGTNGRVWSKPLKNFLETMRKV